MKNVLLVFGGKSYEHDISVVTASQIYNRSKLLDVNLVLFYVSRDERFFIYTGKNLNIKEFSVTNFNEKNKNFKEVFFVTSEKNKIFIKSMFGLKEYMTADFAIFACHGGNGENGRLVSFFENFGIYSSAGSVYSLMATMNKWLFKQVMKGIKIPTVSGFKLTKNDYIKNYDSLKYRFKFMQFPVIIKTNNGGSSIGVFVANHREEFEQNLNAAFEFDEEVLIEKFIAKTREFNVAVIGDSKGIVVSDIDEPTKESDMLSFSDKYLSSSGNKSQKGGVKGGSMVGQARKFPADISDELASKIKGYAEKIFKELGLTGIVRIDFLYSKDTNKLFVCEVNSIPGSLAFYFFKENKLRCDSLVYKLLNIAERNKERANLFNKDFVTNVLDY